MSSMNTNRDAVVDQIFKKYDSFGYTPPNNAFSVLAAFYVLDEQMGETMIISIATGSKCLPTAKFSNTGNTVHDFHAEVLARRGAVRWLMHEMLRGSESRWLKWDEPKQLWRFRNMTSIHMYVSTLPCGDASTRAVALIQDPKMALLKNDSGTREPLRPGLSRGRSGYDRLGIIRTKPGRADAPATLCMSCSDKIATWSSVGMQGALLVDLGLEPVRLSSIVVGDVHGHEKFYGDLELIRKDCRRAFGERLQGVALPGAYEVSIPEIHWTPPRFSGSKRQPMEERTSSNESLFWTAESHKYEILVNGIRRGTSPKNRHLEHLRPLACKASFFLLYHQIAATQKTRPFVPQIYYDAKHGSRASVYHSAKSALRESDGAPFAGWPSKKHTGLELFTVS